MGGGSDISKSLLKKGVMSALGDRQAEGGAPESDAPRARQKASRKA